MVEVAAAQEVRTRPPEMMPWIICYTSNYIRSADILGVAEHARLRLLLQLVQLHRLVQPDQLLVLLELGFLEDVLVLLPQLGLLVEPIALPLLDLQADAHLERFGLVLLLAPQLVEVHPALLAVRQLVLLQLLPLKLVRLYLDLVRLHIVLLLAQLLLHSSQLEQLRTLVELPLYVEVVLRVSLHSRLLYHLLLMFLR
jgi:hypothetical protein